LDNFSSPTKTTHARLAKTFHQTEAPPTTTTIGDSITLTKNDAKTIINTMID